MCHETHPIQEKSAFSFVFPKQLNHIVLTKGLVSFGVVQTESSDPFEFNVKWGGAKVPPFLLPKREEASASRPVEERPQYSSSLKKKSSLEG